MVVNTQVPTPGQKHSAHQETVFESYGLLEVPISKTKDIDVPRNDIYTVCLCWEVSL